jgi:hypothetical protein
MPCLGLTAIADKGDCPALYVPATGLNVCSLQGISGDGIGIASESRKGREGFYSRAMEVARVRLAKGQGVAETAPEVALGDRIPLQERA